MLLHNDRQITISVAGSRYATIWDPQVLTIGQFYDRLSQPARGTETYAEYQKMVKSDQDRLKDVGGFVGGTLEGGRRKAYAVTGRDLITLDFDTIPAYGTRGVLERLRALGCGFCVYSTRKHCEVKPRLRIIFPLDRTVTADEYEPIARRMAEWIGIAMADPTTFEAVRLMFWPSCSVDSEYVFEYADSPLLSADGMLATYQDWRNIQEWPEVPGTAAYQKLAARQGDPEAKPGIVGAFCRTYDVLNAMEHFLPGIYAPVDNAEDRFTYLQGSTAGGAIIYDDAKFLYSHHATDPCSGRLVNSFDLVRLHRFAHEDEDTESGTPTTKLPSYKLMVELATSDQKVAETLTRETYEAAAKDFQAIASQNISSIEGQAADDAEASKPTPLNNEETPSVFAPPEEDNSWMDDLQRNSQTGLAAQTMQNILLILEHDKRLRGKFAYNDFAGRFEIRGALPWNPSEKRRFWSDADSSGLYYYMETAWRITKRTNIDSALDVFTVNHAFNEVQDYLRGLKWDGTPRLDTLLVDYLGADNTPYVRTVTRKAFTAAVARAMVPGCKFDNMLILCGAQGIGKSMILDKMSRGWFNDSIRTFEGKDASELLQGVWIVEIAELDAFRKSEVSRVKQFLSLRVDKYRAAYGRNTKDQPRTCVFFGTCNESEFLTDTTGNRRFWPVDLHEERQTRSVFEDLTADVVDQLWAEAFQRWRSGEDLYLTGEAAAAARASQEEHSVHDTMEADVIEFVGRGVPSGWATMTLDQRRIWWEGGYLHPADGKGGGEPAAESAAWAPGSVVRGERLYERDRICAREVCVELMGRNPWDFRPGDPELKRVNAILSKLPEWTRSGPIYCGPYKTQRGFVRK